MSWATSNEYYSSTKERLVNFRKQKLSYGVSFLDAALGGIRPVDLVLVGAPSGFGKTGFVTTLAKVNALAGKKVHLIALEAYEGEVQDRIHYELLAELFYSDPQRLPNIDFSFSNWLDGKLDFVSKKYEEKISTEFDKLKTLHTFYSNKPFSLPDFREQVKLVAADTDLILLDHINYFAIEDQNENRGMKKLITEIRAIQADIKKPIVVVGHLRKRDKKNSEIVADMEEFMGSSDLVKVATQAITIGRGEMVTAGLSETYFRIAKNRWNSSVTFYCAKVLFNLRRNCYEPKMTVGKLVDGGKEWVKLEPNQLPKWATSETLQNRDPR